MSYQFRPASRSEAKPLVALYAESGAGKTLSALLLARGFVGPQGRIGMIETESGRGEAYADATEYPEVGGYDVLSLRDDFSAKSYGQAIAAAERAKYDALIVDSGSHEWEGIGGVLDQAAAKQAGGAKGVLVWQQPKIDHKRHFMLRLMQTPIPLVILCLRAKYPMVEKQKQGGGKDWVRSDVLEPIQADDVLFEMFVHGWIERGTHAFRLTKSTAKSLAPVFRDGVPISGETGRQLAAWAAGRSAALQQSGGSPAVDSAAPASDMTEAERVHALMLRAEAAADKGTPTLEAFWNGLSRNEKLAVQPQLATLKSRAHSQAGSEAA